MPNRIIREAILSSEKMALLGWPEEVFYRRLMSIVDDFGRYEANPQLLRARCYPLQTDAVRAADISRWMAACQKAGLILCYEVSGKCYLEVLNFQQQQRSASKYPPCVASEIICNQLPADAHLGVSVSVSVVEGVSVSVVEGGKTPRKRSAPRPVLDCPDDVDPQTWTDWQQLRESKKAPVTETVVKGARQEAEKAGLAFTAFLEVWCRRGSQGLEADWLKPHERAAPASFKATVETFKERDDRIGKERWQEMTGQIHPDLTPEKTVIDITPRMELSA